MIESAPTGSSQTMAVVAARQSSSVAQSEAAPIDSVTGHRQVCPARLSRPFQSETRRYGGRIESGWGDLAENSIVVAAPSHGAQSGPAWATGNPENGSAGRSGGAAERQAVTRLINPMAMKR